MLLNDCIYLSVVVFVCILMLATLIIPDILKYPPVVKVVRIRRNSELLEASLAYLWDGTGDEPEWHSGRHRHICYALWYASTVSERGRIAAIRAHIRELLYPYNNYEHWLCKKLEIPVAEGQLDTIEVQISRRHWVLELADYYRSIGD